MHLPSLKWPPLVYRWKLQYAILALQNGHHPSSLPRMQHSAFFSLIGSLVLLSIFDMTAGRIKLVMQICYVITVPRLVYLGFLILILLRAWITKFEPAATDAISTAILAIAS